MHLIMKRKQAQFEPSDRTFSGLNQCIEVAMGSIIWYGILSLVPLLTQAFSLPPLWNGLLLQAEALLVECSETDRISLSFTLNESGSYSALRRYSHALAVSPGSILLHRAGGFTVPSTTRAAAYRLLSIESSLSKTLHPLLSTAQSFCSPL